MAPKAPRYDRIATKDKITQAHDLGCSYGEIAAFVGVDPDTVYKGAKGLRGFKPRLLVRLDDLIASKGATPMPGQAPQMKFDFETQIIVPTPEGAVLDLRVLKMRNEEVWMVEVRPKKPASIS